MKIENQVAYTLEEGDRRVARGDINVAGAWVVIDNITNDIRGTHRRKGATPEEVIVRVDSLRRSLRAAGAKGVIVCQPKPMRLIDVSPFSCRLDHYLSAQEGDGYGIRTQIRMDYLKADGFHVKPQFDSIIDKTYACAIMGIDVPCPTPRGDFVPDHARRRWESDWPQLGVRRGVEGLTRDHVWKW